MGIGLGKTFLRGRYTRGQQKTVRIVFSVSHTHMEKAMATHSSTLAWKIPWMEEPHRLQSMGSLRVGHD